MKKLIIILMAGAMLAFSACSNSSNDNNNVTPAGGNTITITDNGSIYTATGLPFNQLNSSHKDQIAIITDKASGYATMEIAMFNYGSNIYPFIINIAVTQHGPATGIGIYKTSNGTSDQFTENFSGGQTYTIDSSVINITELSTTVVTGTFTLYLGTKIVTGTISGSSPAIMQI